MRTRMTLLAMSCALALAACGGDDRPATATSEPARAAPADTMDPAPAETVPANPLDPMAPADPVDATAMQDAATPIDPALDPSATADATVAADDPAPAASGSCSVTIEGNDRIQFNLDTIDVPASCSDFTITLNHTGNLPVAAMGHNVVVVATSDFPGVAADGLTAGADADYIPAGDDRVIAHTDMIGGGQSTSVTFSTSSLEQGGDYTFFCSFPGHSALMRGSLNFGG